MNVHDIRRGSTTSRQLSPTFFSRLLLAYLLFIIVLFPFIHVINHFNLQETLPFDWSLFGGETKKSFLTYSLIFSLFLYQLHSRLLLPLREIARQVRGLPATPDEPPRRLLDVRLLAHDVAYIAAIAEHYQRQHHEADAALGEAQQIIHALQQQNHTLLHSTNLQITQQYQSVLAYAHYLEEQVARYRLDPGLRYDFDDVCESSFRLKLIAGALSRIHAAVPAVHAHFALAGLMQQTMLALAPSLDRRAMKLTTAEVDERVAAHSDPEIILHAVWLMLLGIIHYAAEESTLRIRCLRNHAGDRALISIVVSELSPGSLSAAEREAHLARQLQHLTPHMFAETIRIHASVQLAQLLLARLDARITVLPLTQYACELCLDLPAAA